MNLIQEFGQDRFQRFFVGSFFKHEDRAHIISGVDRDRVYARRIGGNTNRIQEKPVDLPHDFFHGIAVLASPELGWRADVNGKFLAYYERNNGSYQRGCAKNNLQGHLSPLSKLSVESGTLKLSRYESDAVVAKLIMEPKHLKLAEGLRRINSGELVSFSISSKLAVFPESDEKLTLMYGMNKVGTVSLNGNIDCTIPYLRTLGEQ